MVIINKHKHYILCCRLIDSAIILYASDMLVYASCPASKKRPSLSDSALMCWSALSNSWFVLTYSCLVLLLQSPLLLSEKAVLPLLGLFKYIFLYCPLPLLWRFLD